MNTKHYIAWVIGIFFIFVFIGAYKPHAPINAGMKNTENLLELSKRVDAQQAVIERILQNESLEDIELMLMEIDHQSRDFYEEIKNTQKMWERNR